MEFSIIDVLFPRMCCICKRYGNYICDDCKKLLKRNLPECYICRRLSPLYASHIKCKNSVSLDNVFVAWEYNNMSARILKLYKYKSVQDISKVLALLFIDTIQKSSFIANLKDTLLIPVPISLIRKNERGFNQMEYITLCISEFFRSDYCNDVIYCKNTNKHQAGKNIDERKSCSENPFYIKVSKQRYENKYKSITLVDDVITTGATLEKITQVIRNAYGHNMQINALCMFRGKPFYTPTSLSP
jgi:ComF family protein